MTMISPHLIECLVDTSQAKALLEREWRNSLSARLFPRSPRCSSEPLSFTSATGRSFSMRITSLGESSRFSTMHSSISEYSLQTNTHAFIQLLPLNRKPLSASEARRAITILLLQLDHNLRRMITMSSSQLSLVCPSCGNALRPNPFDVPFILVIRRNGAIERLFFKTEDSLLKEAMRLTDNKEALCLRMDRIMMTTERVLTTLVCGWCGGYEAFTELEKHHA